jgi:cysteinyl-tRNA synthetase
MALRKVNSIIELVGGTPLIRINRMNPAPGVELFVKLESMNPGGSVKDRIGVTMIEAGERSGQLAAGKIVLEASSGNTAIGLAMACAVKGYKLAVTMSEAASEERKKILRAYGAELIMTPPHLGTDGAIEEAYRLARLEPDKYYLVDQFNNDANWRAHVDGTGPEILEGTSGKVDVVVIAMGTTGTVMGIARFFREHAPHVRVVGVEPYRGHKIQGLKNMKESYPPGIFRPEEVTAIVNVEDEAAYETARRLAREEGMLVGMSAGAAMKIAMDEAVRLGAGTVVALLPDGGERYLSTSLFVSQTAPVKVHLHNTLSRKVEEFQPLREGKVGIYTCGPSLDGPPGLGLCRRMVVADLLRRHLQGRGFQVKHVVNISDADDRTITECLASGAPLAQFALRWEQAFFEAMELLRVLSAHAYPRASEHVQDMVEAARGLIEKKGLAYEKLRSVYFRIAAFDGYGKLSRMGIESARNPETVVYDYYDKDNARDFALFKRSTLAELKAGIYWQTPWGNARPGWHIECATMAPKHLGQPFDIHTASTDLIFPHGDNEIAIAEGLAGKPMARYWLHGEVVMAGNEKVARKEKDITLRHLLDRGFSPAQIRCWLLSTHYRKVLQYNDEELARAGELVGKIDQFAYRLALSPAGLTSPEADQLLFEARNGWLDMLDRDLNVPRALAALLAWVRNVNRLLGRGFLDASQKGRAVRFLKEVDEVLAFVTIPEIESDEGIERLFEERRRAREQKDFARADELRSKLESMGVRIHDALTGSYWERVPKTIDR